MMILIGVIYGIWSLLTEIPTQGIPNSLNIIQHIFAAIFFFYINGTDHISDIYFFA